MRGSDERTGALFSYVDLESRVRKDHPLRTIRRLVNEALSALEGEFSALYSGLGRPSIAPERLLRAMLVQAFYSIRSERQLMERLEFDLLFRWFVGLGVDDAVWDHSSFSKNRDRLLEGDIAAKFLAAVLAQPRVKRLLSTEHFSVDGTLIKAWASMKSFQPKADTAPPDQAEGADDPPPSPPSDTAAPEHRQTEIEPMPRKTSRKRNAEADFRGQKRSNATHASLTDPQARLYKKSPGAGAILCFMGHTLMENRNGLIVQAEVTQADGHAERKAALEMVNRHSPGSTRRLTLGADKGYDSADFISDLRQMCVTPHVARKSRHSAIDGRTTRHSGYAVSQKRRKKIEEPFGWAKTVGSMAQTMLRGTERLGAQFTMTMAACNLARLPKLLAK